MGRYELWIKRIESEWLRTMIQFPKFGLWEIQNKQSPVFEVSTALSLPTEMFFIFSVRSIWKTT